MVWDDVSIVLFQLIWNSVSHLGTTWDIWSSYSTAVDFFLFVRNTGWLIRSFWHSSIVGSVVLWHNTIQWFPGSQVWERRRRPWLHTQSNQEGPVVSSFYVTLALWCCCGACTSTPQYSSCSPQECLCMIGDGWNYHSNHILDSSAELAKCLFQWQATTVHHILWLCGTPVKVGVLKFRYSFW